VFFFIDEPLEIEYSYNNTIIPLGSCITFNASTHSFKLIAELPYERYIVGKKIIYCRYIHQYLNTDKDANDTAQLRINPFKVSNSSSCNSHMRRQL